MVKKALVNFKILKTYFYLFVFTLNLEVDQFFNQIHFWGFKIVCGGLF